ncbi:hypothetical protein CBS147332_6773 [Penicillium roqueforti]|nr:hypothetical protein CBS147332_6773 [Penicillium roqueforti]KAI3112145.1 hypothetical protein CBS147331_4699 [Penicillium roqueforti]
MAPWKSGHDSNASDYFELDIGGDSVAEVRWWAAILAGGRGWQATLLRGNEAYFPPWEYHLNGNDFRICHDTELPYFLPTLEPPSSAVAREYLYNFARRHDAFDQLICALAATLMLPMYGRFGAAIVLPRPMRRQGSRQQTETLFADQIPTFDDISRYMAF